MDPTSYEQLNHYRRSVREMYGRVRRTESDPITAWHRFRREREELFRSHPQSALSERQRAEFERLPYFDYQPELRLLLTAKEVEPETLEVELEEDGITRMRRFAKIEFEIAGRPVSLSLFWILGYGGGLFLPFRDRTNGAETYGGGRYLLDTIKGADLGEVEGRLVIDFNYAYNPSCAYHPRWHCPLAPPENALPVPIRAGELRFPWEGAPSQIS